MNVKHPPIPRQTFTINGLTQETLKANADYIFRAVTAHDALVEALELIVYQLSADETTGEPSFMPQIRAALKLAKGED